MCACVCWLIIQYAVFKCKPWRPDPQLLSGSVAGRVSVELAYKEVTREVTTGIESIIHIKLLCQVLPWLHQVSPFQALLEPSACQQRACPGQPSAARRHLLMGPPSVHLGSSVS